MPDDGQQQPRMNEARLRRLLLMLSSPHDGEIVAAARAISRTLAETGHDFHDLAARLTAPPSPAEIARWCLAHAGGRLPERELEFLAAMIRWRGAISDRQQTWLNDIFNHCLRKEEAA